MSIRFLPLVISNAGGGNMLIYHQKMNVLAQRMGTVLQHQESEFGQHTIWTPTLHLLKCFIDLFCTIRPPLHLGYTPLSWLCLTLLCIAHFLDVLSYWFLASSQPMSLIFVCHRNLAWLGISRDTVINKVYREKYRARKRGRWRQRQRDRDLKSHFRFCFSDLFPILIPLGHALPLGAEKELRICVGEAL